MKKKTLRQPFDSAQGKARGKSKNKEIAKSMYHYLSAWNLPEKTKNAVINYFYFALENPKRAHDQEWFWSEKWQAGEREVDADIKAGRVSKKFKKASDLIKSLKQK